MAKCEVCGNNYERSFEVHRDGERRVFDSFECAIHAMAPRCAHCDCMVIGHGVEVGSTVFCCAHCAREKGHTELVDSVDSETAVR